MRYKRDGVVVGWERLAYRWYVEGGEFLALWISVQEAMVAYQD